MIISEANLDHLFTGVSAAYNKALTNTPSFYKEVAMVVPSSTAANDYSWLGDLPGMREWIGERIVHNLRLHNYRVVNRKFELTLGIPRTTIEDDSYGTFGPLFETMGADAACHPDEMVGDALAGGFTSICYDGQYFFDPDHKVLGPDGVLATTSNMQAGSGPAWYLLDASKPVKPLLFQPRIGYELTRLDRPTDPNVFSKDEYLYGVRARCNAGYGLWQLAYASRQPLTAANYEAARQVMQGRLKDNGKPLNIKPTHLVVPAVLEGAALRLLNSAQVNGTTNEWAGTAKPIVTNYVSGASAPVIVPVSPPASPPASNGGA